MNATAPVLTEIVLAASALATLSVMLGGFAIMFGKRPWANRLFALAALFIVIAVFGPSWLPESQPTVAASGISSPWMLPEWAMIWLFLAGVAAFILKARRLAAAFEIMPALHWIIFPVLTVLNVPLPLWSGPVVEVLAALLLLQSLLSIVFGKDVAAGVIAGLLLRGIDGLLRGPMRKLQTALRGMFE